MSCTGFRLSRCRLALEVGGVDLTLIPRRHHKKGLWRSKGLPSFLHGVLRGERRKNSYGRKLTRDASSHRRKNEKNFFPPFLSSRSTSSTNMMTQSMYTPSAQPAPSNSRRSAEREALGAAKAGRATSATALDKSGEGESKKSFHRSVR